MQKYIKNDVLGCHLVVFALTSYDNKYSADFSLQLVANEKKILHV